jgi:acyl-CoA thioester hydrolase
LSIDTRILQIGGATLLLDQQIRRDGRVLVALELLVACVGHDGRPRRVPAGLRAALVAPDQSPIIPSIVPKTP